MLIETVAAGGSVSFMHPLSRQAAEGFWDQSLTAAERDERVVLGAWDGDALVGTVTLLLDFPDNQPHRAEIAKLMTRLAHRGKGIASRLMRAAEALAVERAARCWCWILRPRRALRAFTKNSASRSPAKYRTLP